MAYKFQAYLNEPEELDALIRLAMRLGYTRVVSGVTVANLSEFVRGIASGEIQCVRRPPGGD